MRIEPLGDRVFLKIIEEKEMKKGSIIIPDVAKEKPQRGEVVAVGPGPVRQPGEEDPHAP